MISPLRLERFRLTELVVDGVADHNATATPNENYDLNVDFNAGTDADNPLRYRFELTVTVRPKSDQCAYRRLQVAAIGIFSLPEGASDAETRLIPQAPLAMLYGMMRGIVASATALGPRPHLLPSVNFYEVIKRKAEEQEAKKSQAKTTARSRKRKQSRK